MIKERYFVLMFLMREVDYVPDSKYPFICSLNLTPRSVELSSTVILESDVSSNSTLIFCNAWIFCVHTKHSITINNDGEDFIFVIVRLRE